MGKGNLIDKETLVQGSDIRQDGVTRVSILGLALISA